MDAYDLLLFSQHLHMPAPTTLECFGRLIALLDNEDGRVSTC